MVESFTYGTIAGNSSVETFNQWSTSDSNDSLAFDDEITWNDRRSLKLTYSGTGTKTYFTKGIDGTPYTHTSWNNPIGSGSSSYPYADPTSYTNFGMWVYPATHDYVDNNTMLDIGYFDLDNLGPISGYWNSSVGVTGEWQWFDTAATMSYSDVDRYFIGINSASSGTLYANTLCTFRRSTSNRSVSSDSTDSSTTSATGNFTWKNGLAVVINNITETQFGYSISGILDHKYHRQSRKQLLEMMTVGLNTHPILRKSMPKFSSIKDECNLKTYLFINKSESPYDSGTTNLETIADVVLISNVTFNHVQGKPHIIRFTADLVKFSGV